MVTSDFKPEVKIWPFRACTMHPANCDVIFGNWVKTSLQTRSHRRQDWTKLFCLQYIFRTTENCPRLSRTHFTPQDKTRQDSLVLSASAVWTRHMTVRWRLTLICVCRRASVTAGCGLQRRIQCLCRRGVATHRSAGHHHRHHPSTPSSRSRCPPSTLRRWWRQYDVTVVVWRHCGTATTPFRLDVDPRRRRMSSRDFQTEPPTPAGGHPAVDPPRSAASLPGEHGRRLLEHRLPLSIPVSAGCGLVRRSRDGRWVSAVDAACEPLRHADADDDDEAARRSAVDDDHRASCAEPRQQVRVCQRQDGADVEALVMTVSHYRWWV